MYAVRYQMRIKHSRMKLHVSTGGQNFLEDMRDKRLINKLINLPHLQNKRGIPISSAANISIFFFIFFFVLTISFY